MLLFEPELHLLLRIPKYSMYFYGIWKISHDLEIKRGGFTIPKTLTESRFYLLTLIDLINHAHRYHYVHVYRRSCDTYSVTDQVLSSFINLTISKRFSTDFKAYDFGLQHFEMDICTRGLRGSTSHSLWILLF